MSCRRPSGRLGESGLPLVSIFFAMNLPEVTSAVVGRLAEALITNCPRLTRFDMYGREDATAQDKDMVAQMVRAADCQHHVQFHVWNTPW